MPKQALETLCGSLGAVQTTGSSKVSCLEFFSPDYMMTFAVWSLYDGGAKQTYKLPRRFRRKHRAQAIK